MTDWSKDTFFPDAGNDDEGWEKDPFVVAQKPEDPLEKSQQNLPPSLRQTAVPEGRTGMLGALSSGADTT